MATVLMLLPSQDFDPTEAAVPWAALRQAGHQVLFATPDGRASSADRLLTDGGYGPLSPLLMTQKTALARYRDMTATDDFHHPAPIAVWRDLPFDALLIPGGHAPGVKTLLDNADAQACVAEAFRRDLPVGAICHGPVLLARARRADGRSVLHGRQTTALTRLLEYSGWLLTCTWLGRHYRTYPTLVAVEVSSALADPRHFRRGPLPLKRDGESDLAAGFAVVDGNYVSARWPGDSHRFATAFLTVLDGAHRTAQNQGGGTDPVPAAPHRD